uniref:RNA 2',3'-cyclic phosphodiesterase n=1 Tax=Staphylothermus marinus TaxID=2280 RepID=A0A7C4D8H3_STAMA
MSEVIRVFIAVDISEQSVLNNLIKIRELLVETGADLKPVADENLHITIRFIGEVPINIVNNICNEMSKIDYKPFKIKVQGIGVFPSISRPRVIWAGVTEGINELTQIHDSVEKILRKLGIPPDREKFIPHITLARVRSDRNISKLVKLINSIVTYEFGEFVVNEIVLKRSILTQSGPIYSNLFSVKARQI